MILKGWYSLDGWITKLILINQTDQPILVSLKLYRGESEKIVATVKIKLPPKKIRFYDLGRIKRAAGCAGIILIESERPIACTSHLVNADDEMKVIDYRLVPQEEMKPCC